MKKNLVHAVLGLLLSIGFTASLHAQWVPTNWPTSKNFFELYSSQNTVLARTWDSLNGGRMLVTADSGSTWTQIASADSNADVLSMVMPNNNILAGTWNGLYQYASGGTGWNAVAPAGMPADSAVWSLAMINSALYAGARGDIYKSLDSGVTWTPADAGIPAIARITSLVGSGDTVLAGSDTNGVFLTINGGTSWTAINTGLTDLHVTQLAVFGSRVFAVTLKGLFVSGNYGASWTADTSSKLDINCFASSENLLFAGTDSSGVYLSVDSGVTWTPFKTGIPAGTRVWSLAVNGENLFAGTSSGVWRDPLKANPVQRPEHFAAAVCTGLQFRKLSGSQAMVEFTLTTPQMVTIEMFDLRGNKTHSLVHKRCGAGLQRLAVSTGSVAPGSYIIKFAAGRTVYHQLAPILH